jgi:hypothetical protein
MKWYQYLEDAKKIRVLWDSVETMATCERKRIDDYSIGDFVKVSKNLIDVMQEIDGCESKRQTQLLIEYVKKYEIKEPSTSIGEFLNTINCAE